MNFAKKNNINIIKMVKFPIKFRDEEQITQDLESKKAKIYKHYFRYESRIFVI